VSFPSEAALDLKGITMLSNFGREQMRKLQKITRFSVLFASSRPAYSIRCAVFPARELRQQNAGKLASRSCTFILTR